MKTTMKKIAAYLLALLLVLQMFPAMAEDQTVSGTQGPITSYRDKLKINAVTSTITVGMSIQLTTTDNYDKITWQSENEDIATVDQYGKVTGVAPGQVKITATEDDHSDSITIRVVGTSSGEEGTGSGEKMVIIINGEKEKVTYDGQEHKLSYTVACDNTDFDEDLLHLVTDEHLASGTACGVYQDQLTKDDFTYEGSEDVEFVITNGWLQIKPASVTIYADTKTKAEGAVDPEFTATVEGLVPGDDPVQIVYTFDVKTENGTTKIIPVADSIQGNYKVSTVSAELIILPARDLYNIVKIGGTYYRLKKTTIWTEKDAKRDAVSGKNLPIDAKDYIVEPYDFANLTIKINGKEYIYKCKENADAIIRGADYYEVKSTAGTITMVKNKIGGMTNNKPNWLVPEADQYQDKNETDSIHRDFEITTYENKLSYEEQIVYYMLSVDGNVSYYKLPAGTITAKPIDTITKNGKINDGDYILEAYDFTNTVLVIDGEEYRYSAEELTGTYDNYYTVSFYDVEKVDMFNRDEKFFKDRSTWLDGAYEEYGNLPNNTTAFHANYKATTHKGVKPERSVTITSDWPSDKIGYVGLKITLTAQLTGFDGLTEGTDYRIQWSYTTDKQNWITVNGAEGATFTFTLDEVTTYYTWRAEAVDLK